MVIPAQRPTAYAHLFIQDYFFTCDNPILVPVLNLSPARITLSAGTVLAKAFQQPVPAIKSDDLRVHPLYRDYIAKTLHVNLNLFVETFSNGGNFLLDDWTLLTNAWINPPWHLLQQTVSKLLVQAPRLWILVCPIFHPSPAWYQVLHSADNLRTFTLPRTVAPGIFLRFDSNNQSTLLPFPDWDVEIAFGNHSSFQLLDATTRDHLTQRLITLSTLTLPDWKTLVSTAEEYRAPLITLLSNYSDLIDGSRLGLTSAAECPITLLDQTPINTPQYRLSRLDSDIVEQEVQNMLALGVIETSVSPWNSPVLLITKKDGSQRFCVDLRKINERTIKDVFPIPHLQDSIDKLGGKTYYTTLDLKSGYWQVPIPLLDRPKTAFSSRSGHYHLARNPFGLCNMPSIFQRFMNSLFAP